jgi:hypothetical protein
MPELNHPAAHFAVFSELPSNSSSKTRRQLPGSPAGEAPRAGAETTGAAGAVVGAAGVPWWDLADDWMRRSVTAIRGRRRWPLARMVSETRVRVRQGDSHTGASRTHRGHCPTSAKCVKWTS